MPRTLPALPAIVLSALLVLPVSLPEDPAPWAASPGDTLSLAEVLDRQASARGGRAALDTLRTLDVRFLVIEPTFALEGRYRATRDGRVRVDVFAGDDTVYAEGIDAEGAWKQQGPDAPVEPLAEAGAAALRHGIAFNLVPLHRFSEEGHELSYEGPERVDGRDYHVLRVVLRDGFEARLYVDPENWLVARRRDVRALHPDADTARGPLETLYRAFEEVCGVKRATRTFQVDLATGDTVQSTRVLDQSCNRPEEVLELAREERS